MNNIHGTQHKIKPIDCLAHVMAVDAAGEKDDVLSIALQMPADFVFNAGQYVVLKFAESLPVRAYSIATTPRSEAETGLIRIHVKIAEDGVVSRYVAGTLKTGDEVAVKGPFGENIFDPADKRPLVLIAGGLGIIPMKAVAETALSSGHAAPVFLYWGTGSAQEQYLAGDLTALGRTYYGFKYRPVTGGSVVVHVVNDFETFAGCRVHMAGPPAMIKAILPELVEKGADRKDIYFDPFE